MVAHTAGECFGVATNQLPDLRQSSMNAWHSLCVRGGLRACWWRGIQLLLLTVLSNTLCHAEEIVLAAEVRAFTPECSRAIPLRRGKLDLWLVLPLLGILLAFIFVP